MVLSTLVKEVILVALQILGMNQLCKFLTRRRPKIVMFHKVYPEGMRDRYSHYISTDLLDDILSYANKNYNVFTLGGLIQYYERHGVYPRNALVFTFDDGFKSVIDCVLPILEKYTIPATVFVCPGLVNEKTTIWPEKIYDAYENGALGNIPYGDLQTLISKLKTMDGCQRNLEFNRLAGENYNVHGSFYTGSNRKLLTWDEIRKLDSSGLVEIGSHSLTHPILSTEAADVAMREIIESREIIEHELGREIVSFCYPNGQEDDYKERDIAVLQSSGYTCAVTAIFGLPDPDAPHQFLLPRFGGDFTSFRQGRKYIDGVEFIQRWLLEKR